MWFRASLVICSILLVSGCQVIQIFGKGDETSPVNEPSPAPSSTPEPPEEPTTVSFIRGDANMNGTIDRGDILQIGEHLYAADSLSCEDAADYNDDGEINVTDAILVGRYLAGTSGPPPNAWPDAGTDPTDDELHCNYYDNSLDEDIALDKLIITDRDTLLVAGLDFENVMNRLASTSGVQGADALETYQDWWTNVQPPRVETYLGSTDPFDTNGLSDALENPDSYVPVAVVNRFDLASDDASDCGEYRVLYGKRSLFRLGDLHNRNLILFEARVPNPTPGDIEGCRPLLDLWNELACGDWFAKGGVLRQAFQFGVGGVPPILHADHYRAGAGQIRTSTFMDQGSASTNTWVFREFNVDTADGFRIAQTSVKENAQPQRFLTLYYDPFYYTFVDSVGALAAGTYTDVSLGAFGEDDSFNAAYGEAIRSSTRSANFNDYVVGNVGSASNPALDVEVTNAAASHGLTSQNIFDRATALTCAGCHANEVLPDLDLGGGVQRPVSLGFHHINEYGVISPALRTVFLPQRDENWNDYNGPATCE